MAQFKARIHLGGKTATGIPVPESVVAKLNGGKRPAVNVTVNSYEYKSTVGSVDGEYMVPISSEHREAANVKAGDEVTVTLELDTAPRTVEVPADLQEVLATDKIASDFFEGLSNSGKKAYTYWIESAKKQETREQRVSQALAMLHNNQKR